jgi:hypothetical protein
VRAPDTAFASAALEDPAAGAKSTGTKTMAALAPRPSYFQIKALSSARVHECR